MRKERILIVEDEYITALNEQQILEAMGYSVIAISSSGEEALQMAISERPDLVLMDYMLKGKMNGVETASAIRAEHNVPVIFLTAHSNQEVVEKIKEIEPHGYIIKPFNKEILINTIEIAFYKSKVERKLQQQQNQLQSILDNATSVIYIKDQQGRYLLINKLFENLFGITDEGIKGKTDYEIFSKEIADTSRANDLHVFDKGEPAEFEETVFLEDGVHTYLTRKFIIRGDDETPDTICGIATDITERKGTEDKFRHMANHDQLTNIPNRTLFMDRLAQNLAKAHRDESMLAVLFIDLDNFKPINDTLGHDVGDQALKLMAKRILLSLRKTDTVARIGGDEFAAIITDVKIKEGVAEVVEKLTKVISVPTDLGDGEICLGASIGVSIYPDHADTAEQLLSLADEDMYKVKEKRKKNYRPLFK